MKVELLDIYGWYITIPGFCSTRIAGPVLTLLRYLKGSNRSQELHPESSTKNDIPKPIGCSDGQSRKTSAGENRKGVIKNGIEYGFVSIKATDFEQEQKNLTMNTKLKYLQTQLEAQIKALQDQINSMRNIQSPNNWLDGQVNKI